jgi:hypothetical protein
LATTSCTTKAKSDTSDARSDKGAELLVQLEAKEAADVAKNGRPGFVNAWAEDGVELVDGGGINSKDEMSKEPWPPGTSLAWTPVHAELAASGDLGYTYGTWVYSSKDKAGKTAVAYGKFTTIWKKQKDGQWKVALNTTNSSPTPKS